MIRAILFDAMGTLIELKQSVGENYAAVGRELELNLNADDLNRAFAQTWRSLPRRPASDGPRADDDRGWWGEIVFRVLEQSKAVLSTLEHEEFFEAAYAYFADPTNWRARPEALETLTALQPRFRLAVLSNFDGRLRLVLTHLGLIHFFEQIFISSELGADKPDPEIFRRALRSLRLEASEVLHVGDDPERDWAGARKAGLHVFELSNPRNSLRDLLGVLPE